MKLNLPMPASACLLLLILAPGTAPAQSNSNPQPPLALSAAVSPGAVDPATGMPTPPEPWIARDWTDPDITLTNVVYAGLPASEVAQEMRKAFQDKFDIVISPGPTSGTIEGIDPGSETINLQLKNVTASEIFRAMNLLLEAENSPVRWQLLVNGRRPLVLLRVIPELLLTVKHHEEYPQHTMVLYVGDLIGDGGITMKQIMDTLADVNDKGCGGAIYVGFHEETQLVIAKGTGEQIALIQHTLDALKEKMLFTHYKNSQKGDEAKPANSGGAK